MVSRHKKQTKMDAFDMSGLESSMSEIETDGEVEWTHEVQNEVKLSQISTSKRHRISQMYFINDSKNGPRKLKDRHSHKSNLSYSRDNLAITRPSIYSTFEFSDSSDDNLYMHNIPYKIDIYRTPDLLNRKEYVVTKRTHKHISRIPLTVDIHLQKQHRIQRKDSGLYSNNPCCEFNYVHTHFYKGVHKVLANTNPERAAIIKEILVYQDEDGDRLLFIAVIMKMDSLCNMLLTFLHNEIFLKTAHNNLFQTALHLAVLVGSEELTRRFVVAGVQIDFQDRNGDTALHIACRRGKMAIAKALLKPVSYLEAKQNSYESSYQRIPQNLEIKNSEGLTCLLIAAYYKHDNIVDLLLCKMADVNARDQKNGMTCLHIFAGDGYVSGVNRLLTETKLDLNAKTYAGFTALDIAKCRNKGHITFMLLYAGAREELKSTNATYKYSEDSDSD